MPTDITKKVRTRNFMETLFHETDGRTARHDEANGNSVQLLCENAKKNTVSEGTYKETNATRESGVS